MRLVDADGLAAVGLVLGGEGLVELGVELARRIVGDIEQRNVRAAAQQRSLPRDAITEAKKPHLPPPSARHNARTPVDGLRRRPGRYQTFMVCEVTRGTPNATHGLRMSPHQVTGDRRASSRPICPQPILHVILTKSIRILLFIQGGSETFFLRPLAPALFFQGLSRSHRAPRSAPAEAGRCANRRSPGIAGMRSGSRRARAPAARRCDG